MALIFYKRKVRRDNLVGQQFGRLTVQSRAGVGKYGAVYWKCLCICGGLKEVTASNLKTGNVASCGCLWKEARSANAKATVRKRKGQKRPSMIRVGTAFRKLLSTYKYSAKSRGYEFSLTEEEFRVLTSGNCYYCGDKPSRKSASYAGEVYEFNGIDRLENSRGYISGNSVPCCWRCNELKGNTPAREFIEYLRKIVGHCAI